MIVSNTLQDPAGNPVRHQPVTIRLVASQADSTAAGTKAGSQETVLDILRLKTNDDGVWSADLTPNNAIAPANTWYDVTERVETNRRQDTYQIVVPDTGGPYWSRSLEVYPLPALPEPFTLGTSPGEPLAISASAGSASQAARANHTHPSRFPAVTRAGLPAAGTAGRMARVTDDVRGIWMDNGSQWFPTNGRVINIQEFGARGDGIAVDTAAIQDAVNAMGADGGTVYVPPGIYLVDAPIVFNNSNITIQGAGRRSRIQTNTANVNVIEVGAVTGTTIRGLRIWGPGSSAGDAFGNGIMLSGSTHATIEHCQIENCSFGIFGRQATSRVLVQGCRSINHIGPGAAGIVFYTSTDLQILGNFIGGTPKGVEINYDGVTDSNDVVLANNIVYANSLALFVFRTNRVTITGNRASLTGGSPESVPIGATECDHVVITGNYTKGGTAAGIYVADSAQDTVVSGNIVDTPESAGGFLGLGINIGGLTRATVVGNHVLSSPNIGISVLSAEAVVSGNFVRNAGSHGIVVDTVTVGATVTGNNVTGATTHGIRVNDGEQSNITGNIVRRCGGHGIELSNQADTLVEGNSCLDNNTTNNADYHGIYVSSGAASARNTIVGNLCRNPSVTGKQQYGVKIAGGADHVVRQNRVQGNVTGGISDGGSGTIVRENTGHATENTGIASGVTDGSTIAHGLVGTPSHVSVVGSIAGEFLSVTARDATTFTVALRKHDGTVGTSQGVYWEARV